MNGSQLMIDEDCEVCRMMAMEAEMGFGPAFWHLDGSHMEEEFAFSSSKTVAEWEAENRRREESYEKFELEWAEREYRRRAKSGMGRDQSESALATTSLCQLQSTAGASGGYCGVAVGEGPGVDAGVGFSIAFTWSRWRRVTMPRRRYQIPSPVSHTSSASTVVPFVSRIVNCPREVF